MSLVNEIDRHSEPNVVESALDDKHPSVTIEQQADAFDELSANQIQEAVRAAFLQHRMTFKEALGLYKPALMWTAVMSATLMMEAYDNHLLSNFFGLPAFQKQFGEPVKGKKIGYEISAPWQSGMAAGKLIGMIVGVQINPYLVNRLGYRWVVIWCLGLMTAFIFMLFFAQTQVVVLLSEFFFNVPFGTISILCQAYTLELMPLGLRHWGPTFCQLMRNIGTLITAGILQGLQSNTTEWGWRIPVAIQWAWPLPLAILVYLAPESPWWLARKGRNDDALAVLKRLSSPSVNNEESLALIRHTIALEKKLKVGSRFSDCFKGTNLRRTEIGVVVRAGDAFATLGVAGGTFFFENAGLDAADAFSLNLGTTALQAIASFAVLFVLARVGRRKLWLTTFTISPILCLIVGILAFQPQTRAIIWAQAVLVILLGVTQSFGSAPLALVIGTEIFAVQLRQQTMAIGANAALVVNIITHWVSPYLLNANQANLAGKAAWVAFGICLAILVWAYFRLPESKGKSPEQLDALFAQRVPARQFRTHVLEGVEAELIAENLEKDVSV